jgi:RimJ/RimL family protein N-acetyltransferase
MNLARLGAPLSFETERLLIRRYRRTDDATLFDAAGESIEEVYPFLPWCHPGYKIEESRAWLANVEGEWNRGDSFNFAIFDKGGAFLGGCGLSRIDEHPAANLGYWVRTSAAGTGIATEATIALADFGIQKLELARIEIIMSTRNLPSRRVAQKSGATYEGLLRRRLLLHDEIHDAYLYSVTQPSHSED